MDVKIIKFLISQGANVHAEDNDGVDCCEKICGNEKYESLHHAFDGNCKIKNKKLRIKP